MKKIVQTCTISPSQWEGETDDGQFVYIRYRFGDLTIEIADNKEAWSDGKLRVILDEHIGGRYDGEMDTSRMLELSGISFLVN